VSLCRGLCRGHLCSDLDTRTGEVLRFGDQARRRLHPRVDGHSLSMKKKTKITKKEVEPGEKSPAQVRLGRWLPGVREQKRGAIPRNTETVKTNPSPGAGLPSSPGTLNVPQAGVTVTEATDSKNKISSTTARRPVSKKPVPKRDTTPVRLGLKPENECVCSIFLLLLDSNLLDSKCKKCKC